MPPSPSHIYAKLLMPRSRAAALPRVKAPHPCEALTFSN